MISSRYEMRSMEGYRSGLGKADFFEWVCFHFVERKKKSRYHAVGSQECRDLGVCKSVINAALERCQVKFVTAIRPKGLSFSH
jgi:hypothetical protein